LGLSACANDSDELIKNEQNFNLEFQSKDFFCGAGQHLEVTFETELFFSIKVVQIKVLAVAVLDSVLVLT
tara:strand:+ start:185 stop:394 length:210 start_codon:yes stop_codon:yes gene_type:complete